MEFEENLDLKGKVIEYQNTPLLVVEQFNYKDKSYLYTVNMDIIDERIEVTFLRKLEASTYEHINEKGLLKELFVVVAGIKLDEEIKKLLDE